MVICLRSASRGPNGRGHRPASVGGSSKPAVSGLEFHGNEATGGLRPLVSVTGVNKEYSTRPRLR